MRIVLLLTLLLNSLPAFLQLPTRQPIPASAREPLRRNTTSSVEICDNNIDDDGNGLVDCKDFSCYFKPGESGCACYPMDLIWIGSGSSELYWVDLQTHIEKRVGTMQVTMSDITWTPQGKLYGMTFDGLYEIDPATANVSWLGPVPGYNITNALTSDEAGNLFMSAMSPSLHTWIIKYNPTSKATSVVCDLSALNAISGGDLAFSGGLLYLACVNNKIARINIHTGAAEVFDILGLPGGASTFGIVSVAGGKLYVSDVTRLYSLDLVTFEATPYYNCTSLGINIWGMANYNDFCSATAVCHGNVHIAPQTAPPFCNNTGVILKGDGSGLNGTTAYSWWGPNGSQIDADSINAIQSGKYKVRYHTIPDSCEAWDSVTISLDDGPHADLGVDTIVCHGLQLTIENKNSTNITSWLWSNGTTNPQLTIDQPGDYWLQVGSNCGIARDTIHISEVIPPSPVDLGSDILICPGESVLLRNKNGKENGVTYLWNDGSASDSLKAGKPGLYWLQSSNRCGAPRDSLLVIAKDSCVCNPVYAAAELGPSRELCKLDTLMLTNFLDAPSFRYRWSDGSSKKSFVVNAPGRYWVDVSTYCNTVTDTVVVIEKQGCECKVSIPNAFSPHVSSRNQKLNVHSSCPIKGELSVFNRWGQLIFRSSDLASGWDGTFRGVTQESGTYVYQLIYHFVNTSAPGTHIEKGSFILVR